MVISGEAESNRLIAVSIKGRSVSSTKKWGAALSFLDLISGKSWERAVFTTYALSLGFYEAVILDALVRGGSKQSLILADTSGVRAALGEYGARRAGRDYEIEPVAVSRGVFHPKITTLYAQDDCHLLVGSGNLTFGGWGSNLEVVEHLHPSFAADAFADMADFFELLSGSERVRHGVSDHCMTVARDLRLAITGQQRDGNIRVFHSLIGAISDQILQAAEDLGGAQKLVAAAPFWDEGSSISNLTSALNLQEVFVHAHAGGTVVGRLGSNWPGKATTKINAIELDILEEEEPRRLHAKVMEIQCRNGRIVLSGSANMTNAALGEGGNIEAVVARIQRNTMTGWSFSPAQPLEAVIPFEEDECEATEDVDILRAVLNGDTIDGLILSKTMSGRAEVFQVTSGKPEKLGETVIGPKRDFRVLAPDLEMLSWRGGRLILRVIDNNGSVAEGFVSIAAFAEITRRAGGMASGLLAILYGTETPADVAAIMSWLQEDPSRLSSSHKPTSAGQIETGSQEIGGRVAVAELRIVEPLPLTDDASYPYLQDTGWRRFMEHIFSALREPRGPIGHSDNKGHPGDEDDDDGIVPSGDKQRPPDPAIARALANFEKLFEVLLSPTHAANRALTAFDLANFICDRLDPTPAQANEWLERLLATLVEVKPTDDRIEDVAAAIVTQTAFSNVQYGARRARTRLLAIGYPTDGPPPQQKLAGFSTVLEPKSPISAVWSQVQSTRTSSEMVAAYRAALSGQEPTNNFEELEQLAPEEWPRMKEALRSTRARKDILIAPKWTGGCPKCHSALPAVEVHKIRRLGIATANNCCRRVLVCMVV